MIQAACSGSLCGFGPRRASRSYSLPPGPAAPETKRQRPALRFRFPPALGSGGCLPARALLGESEVPGAAQSFPGRGEWGGGPSREPTPAGRGNPSRLCPRWPRPGVRCRHCSCDLPRVCTRRGRPRTRGPFPAARPGQGRRGPVRSGAKPQAVGALALARQVGGGGAGSFGSRWAVGVGAL